MSNTDDKLDEIISKYLHIPKELLHLDEETVELKQAIQDLITKAKMQVIRDIKNSEGYGKMPIGMRDLLSDMSQDLNAQLKEQTNK